MARRRPFGFAQDRVRRRSWDRGDPACGIRHAACKERMLRADAACKERMLRADAASKK